MKYFTIALYGVVLLNVALAILQLYGGHVDKATFSMTVAIFIIVANKL